MIAVTRARGVEPGEPAGPWPLLAPAVAAGAIPAAVGGLGRPRAAAISVTTAIAVAPRPNVGVTGWAIVRLRSIDATVAVGIAPRRYVDGAVAARAIIVVAPGFATTTAGTRRIAIAAGAVSIRRTRRTRAAGWTALAAAVTVGLARGLARCLARCLAWCLAWCL